MKLEKSFGNLVAKAKDAQFDVIIHCQNCFHGWKKGIVKEIASTFPEAKKADLATRYGDKKKLGTYSSATINLECGKTLVVANLYAQFSFGQGKHLKDKALRDCLMKINSDFAGLKIGYPLIGAGQAGGDWAEIEKIIDETLTDVDHQLVVFRK
ncbi:TPA: phosphatase [Vibrio parahaemolyticus]